MKGLGFGFYNGLVDCDWAPALANADWHLWQDPPAQDPLPGRNLIGRPPVAQGVTNGDAWEWGFVERGAKGAEDYANFCLPYWRRARYIKVWQVTNEPPSTTPDQARLLSAFYVALAPLAASEGVGLAGGAFSRGRPDEHILAEYAPMARVCRMLLFHEYGVRDLRAPADLGWHAFRYTRLLDVLRGLGIDRPACISELNSDDGAGHGLAGRLTSPELLAQFRWYMQRLAADPRVVGAILFRVSAHGFYDFACSQGLCQGVFLLNRDLALSQPLPPASQPTPSPIPEKPLMESHLARPLDMKTYPEVSQYFGEHAADYARFGLAGHNGIDYPAPTGATVMAAHAGTVDEIGFDATGYGNYVRLAGRGFVTIYAHLSKVCVAKGQTVTQGQKIGEVGNTGNSTGPHLHWGLKFTAGVNPAYLGWVDPVPFRDI